MAQYLTAIGQDSHRFEIVHGMSQVSKPLILGGIVIPDIEGLEGNSDADVILHALTNAISGITGINVLGDIADEMCLVRSITDSRVYLEYALGNLGIGKLVHISFSIECMRPKLSAYLNSIRMNISGITGVPMKSIGITVTSGEGLTDFGRGIGIQAICIVTIERENNE